MPQWLKENSSVYDKTILRCPVSELVRVFIYESTVKWQKTRKGILYRSAEARNVTCEMQKTQHSYTTHPCWIFVLSVIKK